MTDERGQINAEQYATLMRPLNGTRVAKRSQGGQQLSYLEAWDVRAHLIRVFGFGNFDAEILDATHMFNREYESSGNPPKPMVEVGYKVRFRLTIRDSAGTQIAQYIECAVGSASGPANMLGEHHDNAVKNGASDALKRCAINLGTQFGLSLYDKGSLKEIIRGTIVKPEGVPEKPQPTAEQAQALKNAVGQDQPTEKPEAEQYDDGRVGAVGMG